MRDLQYVATMKKGESAVETLKVAVADLWRKGAVFDWPTATAPAPAEHPECALAFPSPSPLSSSVGI